MLRVRKMNKITWVSMFLEKVRGSLGMCNTRMRVVRLLNPILAFCRKMAICLAVRATSSYSKQRNLAQLENITPPSIGTREATLLVL